MPILGLDIGSKSIKLVQLEKAGDKYSLLAAGITSSPVADVPSATEQDLGLVAEAVKKLFTEIKATVRNVNVALPENKVFTPFIKLPYLTDKEIDSAISWQAEPYIPIPVAEASIDYQVIGRTEPQGNKPGGVEVLLVAAPKTLVQKYAKVATLAGLTVTMVETELLALVRAIAPKGQTVVVADFGATSSSVAIVRDGQLVISHSVPTGGEALTRAVASSLGMNIQQAEEYKKAYGLNTGTAEGKVAEALSPVLRVIADEVKKAIQYYKTEAGDNNSISSLILTGGTAGMPEVVPFLANILGMEVVIGDPFSKIAKDGRIEKTFAAFAPLYGVAIGLAQE
ncbi:MAG: type IV pilus assembly protein PilM [Candidatus Blackburnbacteria bacterium]|nr:type IV pilus assembly protein PilM [Candidatus Blackburnbacteria bacterium]